MFGSFHPSQGYNPPHGYNPSQELNPSHGYNPSPEYNLPQEYNPSHGYNPSPEYNPSLEYNPPQEYKPPPILLPPLPKKVSYFWDKPDPENERKQRRGLQAFQQAVNIPIDSSAAYTLSPISSAINDIQDYIDAWKAVRNNATEIIWPFLIDMLKGTNNTIAVNAAWSIYAHLIPTQWCIFGPFFYGLTSLPMLNENGVLNNNTDQNYVGNWSVEELKINEVLINLYAKAWNGAYNALNQSGHLQDLRALNYAIGYHNRSLPFDSNEEDKVEWFFQSLYSPVPADGIV